jgi:sugar/nucleoside kinase (ribokinase family)
MAEARERGMFALADLIALNTDEAEALTGTSLDPDDPGPFLRAVAGEANARRLILTAGARGAWGFEDGRWYHRAVIRVEVASSAGAGDGLLGGVLAAIAVGVPLLPPAGADPAAFTCALDLGVLLAALSVTSPHTIHPGADLDALLAFADRHGVALAPPLADAI